MTKLWTGNHPDDYTHPPIDLNDLTGREEQIFDAGKDLGNEQGRADREEQILELIESQICNKDCGDGGCAALRRLVDEIKKDWELLP